jgi:DNA-binding CsgD family transcriptional regulator
LNITSHNFALTETEKLVSLWNELYAQINDKNLTSKYLQESELYNELARLNNQILIISNFKKHQFLSISNNFDEIYEYGCSKEECIKWGLFYFTKSIPFDQIRVMAQISFWYMKQKKKIVQNPNFRQAYSGWRFKSSKTGKSKYLLTSAQGLEYTERGEPLIVLTTVSDVSHLLVENPPLWSNISFGQSDRQNFLYHSEKRKIAECQLLTVREVEFLKAFESGLDLKMIAESMGISYKTADSHRSNLLRRIGARNPMAAIEILKKANII